ncbi:MAG: serine/threonine-protein kinase [Pseudomonadota bacterium]
MKPSDRLRALRARALATAAETRAILARPPLRERWIADAGTPTGIVLAATLLAGIYLLPGIIDALAGWLTPELRSKGFLGLNRVRANPLRPWMEGLLWLLYAGGALYLAGRVAWLRRPPTDMDDADRTLVNPRAPTLAAGTAAGQPETERYRIENELGRGAMGIVYRAEDTRLRRAVALKVLAPHVAHDENLRARFLREAQAVARLNHRNIVQVYDLVDTPDGCRIAMEFVRGPSLAELTGRQPQTVADVLRWGSELADALACAHEQNVIHRDLKPANVLMAELTQPKITDFGLARFTDSESQATQIGTVMGSPAYMSPEQAAGQTTDERTDIYAFGILLYELLDGRPPFTGDSAQVMAAQVTRTPDDIRTRRADIPEALAVLVMQMLAKMPDERPATMREVAKRLAVMR